MSWRLVGCVVGGVLGWAGPLSADTIQGTPLAPMSRPAGETMFTALSASRTGIVVENKYADPEMWGDRYQELIFGGMGTGVAIADFDNDGRPDVFVVSKTEQSRLFRNLGNWQFSDVTETAGLAGPTGWWDQGVAWVNRLIGDDEANGRDPGHWEQGAAFVDVDNDGWVDLHVSRFGAPNRLYMNQGDGTFVDEAAARGLAVVDGSGTAAFGDYDGDGWLDVYLQTNMFNIAVSPEGQPDRLFRNNGDGTFQDVTAVAGISGQTSGHAVLWWDYNVDGRPDIYVANDFAVPDSLYRNNGDGTFTDVIDAVVPRSPYYSMGADLADVDNDGDFDLFVADMASSTHARDQVSMAGSRARGQKNPTTSGETAQYMRNALYLADAPARVMEGALLAGLSATDWTWSARWEDFDNDGRVDLHVTNGMLRGYHNGDILDRIMVAENPGDSVRIMRDSPVLAEENFAFRNRGDLQFEDVSESWGLAERGVSFGVATGDLDGDGDLDMIYGNFENGPTVLRNDSTSGNRLLVELRGSRSHPQGYGAVVRIETDAGQQARSLLATRGYLSSSEPVLQFGLGDQTRVKRLTVEWPSGNRQVVTDIGAGQRMVIHEADGATLPPAEEPVRPLFRLSKPGVGISAASGPESADDERMRDLQPWRFNQRGPDAVVADFNGDGHDDLAIGATLNEPGQLWLSRAGGGHQAVALPSRGLTSWEGPLVAADWDGDGDVDLLRTSAGARAPAGSPEYGLQILKNDGAGRLTPVAAAKTPAVSMSVGAAVAADFDGDGRMDLFLGSRMVPGDYPHAEGSAWFFGSPEGLKDGTAEWTPANLAPGLITGAWAGDVDGDGWDDLVVAMDWGPVRWWRNLSGRGFEDRTAAAGFASAGTGWWSGISAGDLNGDGRPDFVVGNVGLNTPYRASRDAPAVLFDGDLGGRRPMLLEAYYDGDRLVPRRNRKDVTGQVRNVARKFRDHARYAGATVADLFGAERLAAARRYEANELRSGVFLSQSRGKYEFTPLPRLAQISSVQDAVVGDFDGDGFNDVMVGHNDHRPIDLIGWFEGGMGMMLRGDGAGGLTPVTAVESGIVIPGAVQRINRIDLNGDGLPDLHITRDGQPPIELIIQARR